MVATAKEVLGLTLLEKIAIYCAVLFTCVALKLTFSRSHPPLQQHPHRAPGWVAVNSSPANLKVSLGKLALGLERVGQQGQSLQQAGAQQQQGLVAGPQQQQPGFVVGGQQQQVVASGGQQPAQGVVQKVEKAADGAASKLDDLIVLIGGVQDVYAVFQKQLNGGKAPTESGKASPPAAATQRWGYSGKRGSQVAAVGRKQGSQRSFLSRGKR